MQQLMVFYLLCALDSAAPPAPPQRCSYREPCFRTGVYELILLYFCIPRQIDSCLSLFEDGHQNLGKLFDPCTYIIALTDHSLLAIKPVPPR